MEKRYIDANKIKFIHYINGDITVSKEEIDKIPAADVQEVRHGQWIYKGYHEYHGAMFECSVCKRILFTNSKNDIEKYPYCHCGAKMDGKD